MVVAVPIQLAQLQIQTVQCFQPIGPFDLLHSDVQYVAA